ncbi:class 3 adenylate cyclase [Planomicrobium sp. HSC-17F08]|nr:class 3 adenylate cyclase [Planomicrobium sp. HSC-17F08]
MTVQEKEGFIVFSDLKGFSDLTQTEQEKYLTMHENFVSPSLKPFLNHAIVFNTWGDAIVAVFEKGMDAAEFMLCYRSEAKKFIGVVTEKRVLPRIAGHFGKVNIYIDSLLERHNTISNEVNTAARIEPVTRAGEIFVSEEFKAAFNEQTGQQDHVEFERLGLIPLAKGKGEKVLYRLIKDDEESHIIDELFELDLPKALPEELDLSYEEKQMIQVLNRMEKAALISEVLKTEWEKTHSGIFAFKIAKICKKAGLYQIGLDWLEKAEQESIEMNGFLLFTYKSHKDLIKLKADLLSRLERYNESAEILYSLWRNVEGENIKGASNILSMLAAQFKRQAITKENQLLSSNEIDRDLLEKSASLYLEAFRHDIDNYYPAINAAYLLMMLGGQKEDNSRKLARNIWETWQGEQGTSHWLDFTLAEAKLLLGDFKHAKKMLEKALKTHKKTIGIFDIESVRSQIYQYLVFTGKEAEGKELIDSLEQQMKVL